MTSDPAPSDLTRAQRRWAALPADAPREAYFEALHDVLREYYLGEPGNPYRQSGRSSGAGRWEESRRPIAEAIDRGGDLLDVGCANGLLLESLAGWSAERGHVIRPHGIDFIGELIDLARSRHPAYAASFEVANAFTWTPRRRYDFVRTELVYVPPADRAAYLRRLLDLALTPDGRLVVCAYWNHDASPQDVRAEVEGMGFLAVGSTIGRGVGVVWIDAPRRGDARRV